MELRSSEIAQLMISDIDWRAGTAPLRGTKPLRQDVQTLPMETGRALADYIWSRLSPELRQPRLALSAI